MSRDLFVVNLPAGIVSVDQIPDGFVAGALKVSRSQVIAAIRAEAPDADLSDPSWVRIDRDGGFSIEIDLGDDERLNDFSLHLNGGQAADELAAHILKRLALRAADPAEDSGLFHLTPA